jgi:thymidylate synthase
MNNTDKQFKDLVNHILTNGQKHIDRTGVGTTGVFGHQMRFKMDEGFPLLTLRKIHLKSVIHELLWFLGAFDEKWDRFGNTNIRYLLDNNCTFWSEWPYQEYSKKRAYRPELPELTMKEFEKKIMIDDAFAIEFGSIGKGYGYQWLNLGSNVDKTRDEYGNSSLTITQGINQIDDAIYTLKKNPDSRRIIVDAWNPLDLNDMLLPPCHMMFQFHTYKMTPTERTKEFKKLYPNSNETMKDIKFPERKLNLQLYQRSCDVGLGISYNIAEYSLLLHMVAQIVNMIPNEFIWTGGDVHIYKNHTEQLLKINNRESYKPPTLKLNKNIDSIYNFRYDDIIIDNYQSHPNIKMEVAI